MDFQPGIFWAEKRPAHLIHKWVAQPITRSRLIKKKNFGFLIVFLPQALEVRCGAPRGSIDRCTTVVRCPRQAVLPSANSWSFPIYVSNEMRWMTWSTVCLHIGNFGPICDGKVVSRSYEFEIIKLCCSCTDTKLRSFQESTILLLSDKFVSERSNIYCELQIAKFTD